MLFGLEQWILTLFGSARLDSISIPFITSSSLPHWLDSQTFLPVEMAPFSILMSKATSPLSVELGKSVSRSTLETTLAISFGEMAVVICRPPICLHPILATGPGCFADSQLP